jgi:hypothetical protein
MDNKSDKHLIKDHVEKIKRKHKIWDFAKSFREC